MIDEPFPGSPDDMMQTVASLRAQLDEARAEACIAYLTVDKDLAKQIATLTQERDEARVQWKAWQDIAGNNLDREVILRAQLETAMATLQGIDLMARDYLHVATPPEDQIAQMADHFGNIGLRARSALAALERTKP